MVNKIVLVKPEANTAAPGHYDIVEEVVTVERVVRQRFDIDGNIVPLPEAV